MTQKRGSKDIDIKEDKKGYEILQGTGTVTGKLLGGCLDVFTMINGTGIWPTAEEWKNKLLFIETSEDKPSPDFVKYTFYNLEAQGILKNINGILIGRPKDGEYYDEYNKVIKEASRIFVREDLLIISNCHFEHAWLWNILPVGAEIRLDLDNKKLTLMESLVKKD